MRLTIVISIILLAACGKPHTRRVEIDKQALPYVLSFVRDATYEGKPLIIDDLIVEFESSLGPVEAGRCTLTPNATPKIRISTYFWTQLDDKTREEFVYHELGHCILYRGHLTAAVTINGDAIPKSIMNYMLFSGSTYFNHRSYYVHELFHEGY